MYVPHYFKNDNILEVKDFIDQNGFGILISQDHDHFAATHIPLDLDRNEAGKDVLVGHVSRGNPQWKAFTESRQVLAIFTGPHHYVSSSWYDHENVPTWNYIAVHVYGKIRLIEGDKLHQALAKLVQKYEAHESHPVSVETMSQAFLNKEIRGIVGFEIEIERIQSAYKLSQNRDRVNHDNIVRELEKKGDAQATAVAAAMKDHYRK